MKEYRKRDYPPKRPETLHYRGDGEFMVSGRSISLRKKFKPQNL